MRRKRTKKCNAFIHNMLWGKQLFIIFIVRLKLSTQLLYFVLSGMNYLKHLIIQKLALPFINLQSTVLCMHLYLWKHYKGKKHDPVTSSIEFKVSDKVVCSTLITLYIVSRSYGEYESDRVTRISLFMLSVLIFTCVTLTFHIFLLFIYNMYLLHSKLCYICVEIFMRVENTQKCNR